MGMYLLSIIYLMGSVTFILGLKMLSHPLTARRGNLVAAAGMGLAILGTIFLYRQDSGQSLQNGRWILMGLLLGGILGTIGAKKVKMTAMPEMVSMFNGMGGLCAALIAIIEFLHLLHQHGELISPGSSASIVSKGLIFILSVEMIIGTISFSGSMVAFGKLNGRIRDNGFTPPQTLNVVILTGIFVATYYFIAITPEVNPSFALLVLPTFQPISGYLFFGIFILAFLYGILFVLPIGGADMPVVISLLNSCTGIAAAFGGFLYHNSLMLTGGILVGSAGGILTVLMCKAMNRSLKNVLIGSFGVSNKNDQGVPGILGSYKEISLSDAAVVLGYSNKVLIVPGYGLAVAQAQHACHELEKLLEERGVQVKYAIHPVAGRMPGHMNVLLAEADVPYEKLLEMGEANQEFLTTDSVLILGANDVVNPAAKNDPSSPIFGMPILEVENAKMIIVNKRSMKPGYAGIENNLFFQPKTSMLFGDAKQVLQQLALQIREL
ncbi:MAG: NAD(P)(+) transhydrogenase (Re/Si-specific) subunit beta [Chitinophagaceae bacterium]